MAASKKKRLSLILEIITGGELSSQRELLEKLRERGVRTTQATISRDVRELGLVKVATGKHSSRYLAPEEGKPAVGSGLTPRGTSIGDVVRDIEAAGHLLVIHTLPGSAQSVAWTVDALKWPELVGTVGGDDTVLAVLRSPESASPVRKRLEKFFFGLED